MARIAKGTTRSRLRAVALGGWLAGLVVPASGGELSQRVTLVEVAAEWGLDFVHQTGSEGSYPMAAILGSGAAVFDADNDGDLDIYLVNGADAFPFDRGQSGARNALYLQAAPGSFVDSTEGSGLGDRYFGMGTAVGDIDADGDLDIFVSNWGRDSLYGNQGDGTFVDITDSAGVGDEGWSASAVFCDLDGDDRLDLYVARYVAADPSGECILGRGRNDYCGPSQNAGLSDRLYRNLGDGRFENLSATAGMDSYEDAGLGVVCLDFNDDERLDLYVANDTDPNHLWINQGGDRFLNDAILAGIALNRDGKAEAGMGIAVGDPDGDADLDLFVTNFEGETNTLYENRGHTSYEDVTTASGLALPSLPFTGFGNAFVDLDGDGDQDLVIVNGSVARRDEPLLDEGAGFWGPYAEPNLIFENDGSGRFTDVTSELGAWSASIATSRGLIAADFDGDGDQDLLTTQVEGPVQLWRNDATTPGAAAAGPSTGSYLTTAVAPRRQ
ncbi:MAG: VCBS repeat-containing protein [Acidobacteriota bacterium]|nr:VCBS repeat-containing protein [Acidobacteriota bacterium]